MPNTFFTFPNTVNSVQQITFLFIFQNSTKHGVPNLCIDHCSLTAHYIVTLIFHDRIPCSAYLDTEFLIHFTR